MGFWRDAAICQFVRLCGSIARCSEQVLTEVRLIVHFCSPTAPTRNGGNDVIRNPFSTPMTHINLIPADITFTERTHGQRLEKTMSAVLLQYLETIYHLRAFLVFEGELRLSISGRDHRSGAKIFAKIFTRS